MLKFFAILSLALTVACTPPDNYTPPGTVDSGTVDSTSVPSGGVAVSRAPGDATEVTPPEAPSDSDFCHPGDACDWTGDPRLSRLTDPTKSSFTMRPDNKLFQPGDAVSFEVCARDKFGAPVPGVPGTVWLVARGERIAGDGTTLTGADGCVKVGYMVQEKDMIGDPNSEETDSGSYIVVAYTGGRLVRKVKVLHDSW